MTTERIAAAIKPILDEDRRADRVRIAELERDAALMKGWALRRQKLEETIAELREIDEAQTVAIADLNKQLDELTEKCAALVVERDRLIGEQMNDGWPCRSPTAVVTPGSPEAPTLRIDPDMSDPQPGKLLVVRTDAEDALVMRRGDTFVRVGRSQLVGFLVETPAVEVKRTPKVGDRVRIIKQIEHRDYGVAGEIGTVIGFDGDDVDVKGVGRNGGPWFHSPENLEVIE